VKPAPHPAGPAPISSIKPLLPHKAKAKAAPPDDGLPWGMIGGGLAMLAALGGAAALLRARFFARKGGKAKADPVSGAAAEPRLE
jgi:hypothetical protein